MATAEELQSELDSYKNQVRGLTRKLQAWESVGKEAGDLIRFDHTGAPVGWNVDNDAAPASQPSSPQSQAQQVQGLTEQKVQELMQKQGYVTPTQVQNILNQAAQTIYQASRNDMILFRNIDKIQSEEKFKDLSKYDSPLSKKTSDVLARMGWGKPLNEKAKAWEEWQYASPDVIRQAAQIARAELWEESQANANAQASGQAAQAGAGLSVSPQGQSAPTQGPTDEQIKSMSDEEFDAKLKSDLSANLESIGIK